MLCNNTKFCKHKLQFSSIPIYNEINSDILFYKEIQFRNTCDILHIEMSFDKGWKYEYLMYL